MSRKETVVNVSASDIEEVVRQVKNIEIGENAVSDGVDSVAVGENAITHSNSAIAIGAATANADRSIAIGGGTQVGDACYDSIAIGTNAFVGDRNTPGVNYAVQLGNGVNLKPNTLQYRDFTVIDENGYLPTDRLSVAIPTKVSELENDLKYTTEDYVNSKIGEIDLSEYVKNTDYGDNVQVGVVKMSSEYGTQAMGNGNIGILKASDADIKEGETNYRPIVPSSQEKSVFYGLAKASGDATQTTSDNPVGQYTDEALSKIQSMLGINKKVNRLEFIGSYTFAEDSSTTTVWSLPSDADYLGLSEVYIIVDLKSNSHGVTDIPYLNLWDGVSNSRTLMCQLCPCWKPVTTNPPSVMNRCIYNGRMMNGTMYPIYARYGNSKQYPYSINDHLSAQTYTLSRNTPYLNEIQLQCNGAGIGAGTTVELWGVKYYE